MSRSRNLVASIGLGSMLTLLAIASACGEPDWTWACCPTDDDAFCNCFWSDGEQNLCETELRSCDPSVVGGDPAICCTDESVDRPGEYDCACFGGHFDTAKGCDTDGGGFAGRVDSCTEPPHGPGTRGTGGAGGTGPGSTSTGPGATTGPSGCDAASCSGCVTSCDDTGCYSCCYGCNGSTCEQNCNF